MTCIVAYSDGKNAWIGADSASVSGWEITLSWYPKVFRNGNFLMGYAGSWRLGQILEHDFSPPKYDPQIHESIHAFLCTVFVRQLYQCLKQNGHSKKENDTESLTPNSGFLLAWESRIFRVDQEFQVTSPVCNYEAMGSGAAIALGAFFAMQETALQLTPRDRVRMALLSVATHNIAVREPFTIRSTE